VYVEPEDVSNKARSFKNLGYDVQVAETAWMPLPEGQQQLEGSSEQAQKISKVIDELGAEEEVTGVYSNAVFNT
jgi:transcriptional/translational regulatory protein YebC/TACO1